VGEDMNRDLPGAGLDHGELVDVLRRTMAAAGMEVGADVRDLPARVAYLRGQAEVRPPGREPWADVPEPLGSPRPGPGQTPGWPAPPPVT
jgi:hypothetical protein